MKKRKYNKVAMEKEKNLMMPMNMKQNFLKFNRDKCKQRKV